jgi:hypothetical protein
MATSGGDRDGAQSGGRGDGRPSFLIRNPAGQPSKTDEMEFDLAMLTKGGRFDIAAHDDDVQDCFFDLRWRGKILLDRLVEPPQTFDRVVFDFTQEVAPGACVAKRNGRCYIGISYGFVKRLYEITYALMCLPDVLPDLGNAAASPATEREVADVVFGAHRAFGGPPRPLVYSQPPSLALAELDPVDLDRRYAAHGLAGTALQWILYHEYFHASSGHLDLAQQVTGDALFSFEEGDRPPRLSVDVAHLIEADADRRAAWRAADEVLNRGLMLNALARDQLTVNQHLEGWALVNTAVFWQLSGGERQEQILDRPTSHPHPEVRFWFTFGRFEQHLKDNAGDLVERYHRDVNRSIKTLRRLWRLAGREGDVFIPDERRTETIIEEGNRLNREIGDRLFPLTAPFDYFQILTERQRAQREAPNVTAPDQL